MRKIINYDNKTYINLLMFKLNQFYVHFNLNSKMNSNLIVKKLCLKLYLKLRLLNRVPYNLLFIYLFLLN